VVGCMTSRGISKPIFPKQEPRKLGQNLYLPQVGSLR
jgi:hypothetical protein